LNYGTPTKLNVSTMFPNGLKFEVGKFNFAIGETSEGPVAVRKANLFFDRKPMDGRLAFFSYLHSGANPTTEFTDTTPAL
jgi:hypothetical protein